MAQTRLSDLHRRTAQEREAGPRKTDAKELVWPPNFALLHPLFLGPLKSRLLRLLCSPSTLTLLDTRLDRLGEQIHAQQSCLCWIWEGEKGQVKKRGTLRRRELSCWWKGIGIQDEGARALELSWTVEARVAGWMPPFYGRDEWLTRIECNGSEMY